MYFSDAVFAIAMTLLVLDLAIPAGSTSALQVVSEEWPSYLAFALSFTIVAFFWVNHHRRFRVVIGYDTGFIVINLVLLFFVASVPFPTMLLSEFAPETTAVVLYAALVATISLVELVQWVYAKRRGLLAPSVDSGIFWWVIADFMPVLLVFAASVPIALIWGGDVAMNSWFAALVLGPVLGIITSRMIDRRQRSR